MKIRTGFVSNSSSSSFVVLFPKEPKNATDVRDMLFSKSETIYANPYQYGDDEFGWPADQVAETVWKDICGQEKNNFEKAKEMIMSGYLECDGVPDIDSYQHIQDNRLKWDTYHADMDRFAEKKMKEFFNLRKLKLQKLNNEPVVDSVLYCFEYSDGGGTYFSALEHGDLFKNLKHIKISNH